MNIKSTRILFCLVALALFQQCQREIKPLSDADRRALSGLTDVTIETTFDPTANLNISFIGNSLTYTNDVPSLVKEIAAIDNLKVSVTVSAFPNFSFDDHLAAGTIQATLAAHAYDFMIGQQGPSALIESQELLKLSSVKIASQCRLNGTRFGLYMVWPSLERDFDRAACIASYTNAAIESNSLLCPAGLAWSLARKKDPSMPLYGPDNFHPAFHGSLLAAIVIYASIAGKTDLDFLELSKTPWQASVTEAQLEVMKSSALEAIRIK